MSSRRKLGKGRGQELRPTLVEVFKGLRREPRPALQGWKPDWSERVSPEQLAELDDKRTGFTAEQDAVRRLAGCCDACGHQVIDHVEVWLVDTRVEAMVLGVDRSTPAVVVCCAGNCQCSQRAET